MISSYPLRWPDGVPRIEPGWRKRGTFKVDTLESEAFLRDELTKLGGSELIISSNVRVKPNGFPRANDPAPRDPGVAIYFTMKKKTMSMGCDAYDSVRANVRALGYCLQALRSLERHGSSAILERAFRGFAALPAIASPASWTAALGVQEGASQAEIDKAFREQAKKLHPDKGGSDEAMSNLNAAREAALNGGKS